MRGKSTPEVDWYKRNVVVPEKVIRKSIQDGLHETIQDEINLKDNKYCLVSDERFKDYLDTIKNNKMHWRNNQKRAPYKFKSSSRSNDE